MSTHRLSLNCVCVWFQVSTRLLTSQRWHIPSGILALSASAWRPSSEGAGPTHPPPPLCWTRHMTSLPQHVSLVPHACPFFVVARDQEVRREEGRECLFHYDWTTEMRTLAIQAVGNGIHAGLKKKKEGGCSLIAKGLAVNQAMLVTLGVVLSL